MAALGQALPPQARSGLALLLRRGLWGWVRAMAQGNELECAGRFATHKLATPRQQSAVIQILATMAMKANTRRAT